MVSPPADTCRMPSSVAGILAAAELSHREVVGWGVPPTFAGPGVYLVTLSAQPDACDSRAHAPLSRPRIQQLLDVRPELTVDGVRPELAQLHARLASLWLSDETILYIGRASASVSDRVMAYYKTPLGARAPHAGGWPLKTLHGLGKLHVHVAPAPDPTTAEEAMIDTFIAGVTANDRQKVVDPELPLPFANLEDGRHRRKRHGVRGARAPYARKRRTTVAPASQKPEVTPSRLASVSTGWSRSAEVSLNVTEQDVARGCIRVTKDAKRMLTLPSRAEKVELYIRGHLVTSGWDARLGPDKERSGLLRVGHGRLKEVLKDYPTSLTLRVSAEGVIHLD